MKEDFLFFFHLQIISLLFSLVVYNLLASGQGGGWKSSTSIQYYETTIKCKKTRKPALEIPIRLASLAQSYLFFVFLN